MKFSNIKFLTATLLVLFVSVNSYSQITKAEIIATGLTCSMCSNAINKQLKSMTEVDSVGTNLNTNTFTVYFKKDTSIQPKLLKKAVENAGFFIGSMVLTIKIDTDKIDTDKIENNSIQVKEGTYVLIDSKKQFSSNETAYQVIDKGFVTQKEYKKLTKLFSKHATYTVENENVYHLKTI